VEKVFTLIYARDEEPAARIKILLPKIEHNIASKRNAVVKQVLKK